MLSSLSKTIFYANINIIPNISVCYARVSYFFTSQISSGNDDIGHKPYRP